MKKLILLAISVLLVLSTQKIMSATVFYDTFDVTTGGGDVNYDYDAAGRQSGSTAPLAYNTANGPVTVTNAGPHAGKAHFNATTIPSYLNPIHNFTESGNFSISFDLTRFIGVTTTEWTTCSFGTDGAWKFPHETATALGFEVIFFQHGWYQVFKPGTIIGNFYYPELHVLSNQTLNIEFVVSQTGFPPTSDAKVAMFINGKPYPLVNVENPPGSNTYVATYFGGFTNNFINFITLHSSTADLDNFKITTPDNSISTAAWTSDSNSGISDTKLYTHKVNLADDTNITINGVEFIGSTSNQFGSNWEILTADKNPLGGPLDIFTFGKNPTIAGESINLVSNVFYSVGYGNGGGIVLYGLTPGIPYKLTLFSTAFEGTGNRESYLATSAGGVITAIDQDEFGENNGQVLTYSYIAPENGTFAVSATPITEPWGFYAFANEISPPPAPTDISASKGTFSDRVIVDWAAVKTADNYILLRNISNDFSSAAELANELTTNTYEDMTTSVGQYYYYWVEAKNTGGVSAATGPAIGYTSTPQPATPVNISPAELNIVTAPVTLSASVFSDPGGYAFSASQWQLSSISDFSSIVYDSGTAIANNIFTPPANASAEVTNYWRVRYKNEFNTWSEWSTPTSFILVPQAPQAEVFLDTFNVVGKGDVNLGYANAGRQFGDAAPLSYTISGVSTVGSESGNPGQLEIGISSGVSPNYSFTDYGDFKIEFDVKPHEPDRTNDWVSLSFGKSDQEDLFPVSPSGAGLVFFGNTGFQAFDGETLVGNGWGVPNDKPLHIVLIASTEGFDNDQVKYVAFANGVPMQANNEISSYMYIDNGGYDNNYISLFSYNYYSPDTSLFDNLKINKTKNSFAVNKWVGDSDMLPMNPAKATHAVNINGPSVNINGVDFVGTGTNFGGHANGSAVVTSNNWQVLSSSGVVVFHNGQNVDASVSGNGKTMMEYFAYFGNAGAILLSDLTPYSTNEISLYSYGWEAAGREVNFATTSGGAISNIDQDVFGVGIGIIARLTYVADKNGEATIVLSPSQAAGWHLAGFYSEEIAAPSARISVSEKLDFGEVVIGNSANLQLEIKNIGSGNVTGVITGATSPFTLSSSSYFAVPQTDAVIEVTFAPSSEGEFSQLISLSGAGGAAEVMLEGTGVPEPFGGLIVWIVIWIAYAQRFI